MKDKPRNNLFRVPAAEALCAAVAIPIASRQKKDRTEARAVQSTRCERPERDSYGTVTKVPVRLQV